MGLFVTKMTAHDAIKEINREREDSPHGNRLTSYTQNSINGTDRDSHHDRNHIINQQKPFLDSCNQ